MVRGIFFDRVLSKKIFDIKNKKNLSVVDENLLKAKKLLSYNKKLKDFYLQKTSLVTKDLIGQRIFVHTGKEIVSLKITPPMVGYKVGEFFFVKKINKTNK
jgi:ribosomal protein S19